MQSRGPERDSEPAEATSGQNCLRRRSLVEPPRSRWTG